MGPSVSGVGVLDKAMVILGAVEAAPRSLGELVEATGFSRATAHRLAVALEVHGLVRRDEDGRFALGRAADRARAGGGRGDPAGRGGAAGADPRCATKPANRCSSTCARGIGGCASPRSSRPTGCGRSCRWGRRCRSTSARPGAILSVPFSDESVPNRRRWAESVGEREAGVASVSAGVLDADGARWPRSACRARSSAPPASPAPATATPSSTPPAASSGPPAWPPDPPRRRPAAGQPPTSRRPAASPGPRSLTGRGMALGSSGHG